jgi:hypothetical protein
LIVFYVFINEKFCGIKGRRGGGGGGGGGVYKTYIGIILYFFVW